MDVADRERVKYETMWAQPAYRERSPGMRMAEQAHQQLRCRPGATLCDWGAGTGRASAWFAAQGLDVTAVDIAANAVTEFDGPVVVANLWDLPAELGAFDFGFCCDVMEHIPPEHVEATLRGIAQRTRRACYFQIALFKCHMGEAHGLHLHLTVKSANWWRAALERQFMYVDMQADSKYVLARATP